MNKTLQILGFLLVLSSFIIATHLKANNLFDSGIRSYIYAFIQCPGLALLALGAGREFKDKFTRILIFYNISMTFGLVFLMWGFDFLLTDFLKTYKIYISFITCSVICILYYIHILLKSHLQQ